MDGAEPVKGGPALDAHASVAGNRPSPLVHRSLPAASTSAAASPATPSSKPGAPAAARAGPSGALALPAPTGYGEAAGDGPTLKTSVLALLGLCCVQVFTATIYKMAVGKEGRYDFSPQASLVMSEFVKALISVTYLFLYDANRSVRKLVSSVFSDSPARMVLSLFVLALMYTMQNGLSFYVFERADPGSIILFKSTTTLMSAILLYFVRGLVLSQELYVVLLMQLGGLIITQYNVCSASMELAVTTCISLFTMVFISAFANVWNESVVKSTPAPLALLNLHLYSYGAIINFAWFTYTSMKNPAAPGFFENYTPAAAGIILANALTGIAINAVYKYADALVRCMSSNLTTIAMVAISGWMFGATTNLVKYAGSLLVVLGTYLYFSIGELEKEVTVILEKEAGKLQEANPTADAPAKTDGGK